MSSVKRIGEVGAGVVLGGLVLGVIGVIVASWLRIRFVEEWAGQNASHLGAELERRSPLRTESEVDGEPETVATQQVPTKRVKRAT